jgi:hypothetical protein
MQGYAEPDFMDTSLSLMHLILKYYWGKVEHYPKGLLKIAAKGDGMRQVIYRSILIQQEIWAGLSLATVRPQQITSSRFCRVIKSIASSNLQAT